MPFLGIDQGTTQTTAVVLGDDGRLMAARKAQVACSFPRPGWVEQDPWEILASVREAAAPLARDYGPRAVGFDNQGETFLLWDGATGRPLTPAIVWQDKRGVEVCRRLAAAVDGDWLRGKTGLLLDTYFSAPKFCALLEADPTLRDAARAGRLRFGTTEAWVLWNLSGGRLHVTDPSTASRTLFFDITRLDWDDELVALFGATRAMLPEVHPSAGYVGELDLGAGGPVPLYGLAVDQQGALFGQACFASGEAKCTFGTGAFLLVNTGPSPRLSRHGLLATVAWRLPEQTAYALDGGVFVAGAAMQWLAEGLRLLPDVAASDAIARESADRGVVFVPALAGLAAPHWSPEARGAIFGLSRASSPADIVRAALEGVACRVYEVAEAMAQDAGQPVAYLKVDGGPSANRYLMQAVADLLGVEVRVAAEREATAIGAANLAAHALGVGLRGLAARWRAEAVYAPRAGAEREARLERWRRALAAVRRYHEGERGLESA